MKNFVLNIIIFFISFMAFSVLLPLLIAISTQFTPIIEKYTFGHIPNWGDAYERSIDYQNWINSNNRPKGLILGSSTAYRNINTQILSNETNINWFNLGSSAQTPRVSLILLKDLLSKIEPEYLIYDVYSVLVDNPGHESAYDLISNSALPLNVKFQLFQINPNFNLFQKLIYRYFQLNLSSKIYRFHRDDNGIYLTGGSTYSPKPHSTFISVKNVVMNPLKLNNELKKIISSCRENHIKFILNISPIINIVNNNTIKDVDLIINDELNNKVDLFYDDHHMHGEGSIEYSKILAKKIIASNYISTSNSKSKTIH